MKALKPTITVLVSNDIEHDQRISKVCGTLRALGFECVVVGRMLPLSKAFACEDQIVRFKLPFHRGAGFYIFLQIRLFLFLLTHKTDVILANDLDTLLPAWLISRLRNKILVYDSHEYFTEAEGLVGRSFQKKIWLSVEKFIFPKLKYVFTVNETIASIYREQYKVNIQVVRNVPLRRNIPETSTRISLSLPEDQKIIVLQGAYLDPGRGGMEAVEAMQFLDNCMLLIIGSGKDLPNMKARTAALSLEKKIRYIDRIPYEKMIAYTRCADIGLSLDKPIALNYKYSLPNKVFDYAQSGIPVIVSDLPELRRIITEYSFGWIVDEITPESISTAIQSALNGGDYQLKKQNAQLAAISLNWQKEQEVLISVYSEILEGLKK